jgi:glycosyltransferase involved in cell wall biosynthesis
MLSPFSVSVIIPAHNAEATLAACLESVCQQSISPADLIEIIVIDNASTDRTAEIVQRWPDPRVKYGFNRNPGANFARNDGIRQATGSIIAFTDADCVAAPDWLENGIQFLAENNVDLVAGVIHIPVDRTASIWAKLDASWYLDQALSVSEGWVATANLMMRRDVIAKVGPFDEVLTAWEDVEFGLRCVRAGFRLAYAPTVRVNHPPRNTLLATLRRNYRSARGLALVTHHDMKVYKHGWRKLLPRPTAKNLYAERLAHLNLKRWQVFQLGLLRYVFVEVHYMFSFAWQRFLARRPHP